MLSSPCIIIVSMSGQVGGLKAGWHVRTNRKTGRMFVASNPHHTKPPTAAQLAARQRFAARYAGSHRPSLSGSHSTESPPPPPSP